MTAPPEWTEESALDRWLSDLERSSVLTEVMESRLDGPPLQPGDDREESYRARAKAWLERDQPEVALALYETAVAQPRSTLEGEVGQAGELPAMAGLASDLDLFAAGRPGSAGLPALTHTELTELRQSKDPEQALKIIEGAGRRLQSHGAEARVLLRRYLERKKGE